MSMLITLEMVRDEWGACYAPDRLALLYAQPKTTLEVLTCQDGEWDSVADKDRLWTVLRRGVIDDKILRLFACWCARQVLPPDADKRSWNAIEVAERYAHGKATEEELSVARDAARAATYAAARDAARAAHAAVRAACRSAVDAARDAAYVAAHAAADAADAADAAGYAAEAAYVKAYAEQVKKLVEMLQAAEY